MDNTATGQPLPQDTKKTNLTTAKYYRIEVLYNDYYNNEMQRHVLQNQTAVDLMKFREILFTVGLMVPRGPGHWQIVHPNRILSVNVWAQANRWKEI